jgi:hypothetical protein
VRTVGELSDEAFGALTADHELNGLKPAPRAGDVEENGDTLWFGVVKLDGSSVKEVCCCT